MCKDNFAIYVNLILSHGSFFYQSLSHFYFILEEFENIISDSLFQIISKIGIIYFTFSLSLKEVSYYVSQTHTFESWRVPSLSSSERSRFLVSNIRLLRCTRFTPGQIRDVEASSPRCLDNYSSCSNIWILSSCLLSSPSSFRRAWTPWINPSQTRSSSCPQTFSSDYEFYTRTTGDKSTSLHGFYSRKSPKPVCNFNSPTQYRTSSIQTPKKILFVKRTETIDSSQLHSVSLYEKLREKVLNHQPVDLGCFLKNGLARWITFEENNHSLSIASPSRPLFINPNTSNFSNSEIISILAAIIFNHHKGDRHANNIPSF